VRSASWGWIKIRFGIDRGGDSHFSLWRGPTLQEIRAAAARGSARSASVARRGTRSLSYRRLHVLLKPEGIQANHKAVYQLYREEGPAGVTAEEEARCGATATDGGVAAGERAWSMDYMSDVLRGGRRIRIFDVVDDLSREGLASEVDTSLPAQRVIQALEEIALERGYPERIVCDKRARVSKPDARLLGL